MDGNRRWARERGLPPFEGHRRGYQVVKQLTRWCIDRRIPLVTLWAFSTENWQRTQQEVGFLMDLLEWALKADLDEFVREGIRLRVVGRREGLRPALCDAIARAEERTAENTTLTLVIALNYGGRAEIVDAVQRLVAGNVRPADITEARLTQEMYWPEMPAPELIIRTSGEERLSGFLLWHAPYSELHWCRPLWPDFSRSSA